MKKQAIKLLEIIKKHGYWSDEVREFNQKLDCDYTKVMQINNLAKGMYNDFIVK